MPVQLTLTGTCAVPEVPPAPTSGDPADMMAAFNAITTPNAAGEHPAAIAAVFDLEDGSYRVLDGSGNVVGLWDITHTHQAVLADGYTQAVLIALPGGGTRIGAGLYLPASALMELKAYDGLGADGLFVAALSERNFPSNQVVSAGVFIKEGTSTVDFDLTVHHLYTGNADGQEAFNFSSAPLCFANDPALWARPVLHYVAWVHPGLRDPDYGLAYGAAGTTPDDQARNVLNSHRIQQVGRDLRAISDDAGGTVYPSGTRYDLHFNPAPGTFGVPNYANAPTVNNTTRAYVVGRGRPTSAQNKILNDWAEAKYDAWSPERDMVVFYGDSFVQPLNASLVTPLARRYDTDSLNYAISGTTLNYQRKIGRCTFDDFDLSKRNAAGAYTIVQVWEFLNQSIISLAHGQDLMTQWSGDFTAHPQWDNRYCGVTASTLPGIPSEATTGLVYDFNQWQRGAAVTSGLYDACADLWQSVPCHKVNYKTYQWWVHQDTDGTTPANRNCAPMIVDPSGATAFYPTVLAYLVNLLAADAAAAGDATIRLRATAAGKYIFGAILAGCTMTINGTTYTVTADAQQLTPDVNYIDVPVAPVVPAGGIPQGALMTAASGGGFLDAHPRASTTNNGPDGWAQNEYRTAIEAARAAMLARR